MIKNRSVSVSYMLMGILFCSCLIISNLLSVKLLRITDSLSISAAIIIFPITYILNDCIAEVWGYRKARLIIWMGFAMNFLCAAFGMIATALPAADYWVQNEEHFNFMFTLAPRVATASFAAFLHASAWLLSDLLPAFLPDSVPRPPVFRGRIQLPGSAFQ